jgi:hypothetical protein
MRNIVSLAFPSDPKPTITIKQSQCGRVWRVIEPSGYSLNSRKTKAGAVALAKRNYPSYAIRVV